VLITSILSNILDRDAVSSELYDFFFTNNSNAPENGQGSLSLERFYNHDLLPRGCDIERQIFDFFPNHIATKGFENNIFDIIMSHKSLIVG
jgi:hypothetical protein